MTAVAAPSSGVVAGRGVDLRYLAWGELSGAEEPLVLLHGIGGLAADWEGVARHVARFRPVVALEARGHGGSGWDDAADYSTDAHFADLVLALEGLRLTRCALMGFSMGGGVAIVAASARPEVVSSLVVVDAYPAPQMTPGSHRIAHAISRWKPRSEDRPRMDPAIAEAFRRDLSERDARRADLWPMWDALDRPTLLVRGANSTVLPAPLAEEMAARQPRATLAEVAGAGHGIPFSHSQELAHAVEAFLAAGA
jgi:pimeloyl-ACP methyl ester carboxylesterase